MHLFYCPEILNEEVYVLPEQEMHHAIHVLRMRTGDKVRLTDGKGNMFQAEIISAQKKECVVKIIASEVQQNDRHYHLHIAIAPVKSSDRFEVFLEKVTEMGVDEITPLLCHNSERRKISIEKNRQTLVSAMKQSGRCYLPQLHELILLKDFILQNSMPQTNKYIAHCKTSVRANFFHSAASAQNVLILIGPEGDFTEEEILLAEKNNFTSVSLGDMRLRTETAGILACAGLHAVHKTN